MDHLSEVMQIIEGARRGDMRKVTAYTELLAKKLEEDGDKRAAEGLRRILAGTDAVVWIPPSIGAPPTCAQADPNDGTYFCYRHVGHRGEHQTRWLPHPTDGRLVERLHWRQGARTAAVTIQTKGSVVP